MRTRVPSISTYQNPDRSQSQLQGPTQHRSLAPRGSTNRNSEGSKQWGGSSLSQNRRSNGNAADAKFSAGGSNRGRLTVGGGGGGGGAIFTRPGFEPGSKRLRSAAFYYSVYQVLPNAPAKPPTKKAKPPPKSAAQSIPVERGEHVQELEVKWSRTKKVLHRAGQGVGLSTLAAH